MSIRPIDMQVLVPKATEASKLQRTMSEADKFAATENFREQINKQVIKNKNTITEPEKAKTNVDKDGSNKHEQERREKQKKRKEEEKKNITSKNSSNSMFDVSI